ncbi:MAG: transporter substrate-binding domain-containing protein [Oscillospiraceae bacterium]
MKKIKSLLALLLATTLCFGALAGCGKKSDDSDLSYLKEKGTLIVGMTEFAPMDFKNNNGEWIGFDADMAKEVAKALGVEVEFIEINWDNKIMELESKSIDCVWNGMTLTDDVKKGMATTNAYANNAQVVVVAADVADKYTSKESIKDLKFAVESGSAGEAAATDLGVNMTAVLTQSDALMEVASGASDACIIDLLMAGAMVGEGTSYPNLALTVKLTSEEYGIGFRKGSNLAEETNKILKDLFASGKMTEIAKTYGVQEAIIAQ